MRNRILGVLIAVLAVLGALNFVQAMRGRFASDHHADTKIERASDFHFKGRLRSPAV